MYLNDFQKLAIDRILSGGADAVTKLIEDIINKNSSYIYFYSIEEDISLCNFVYQIEDTSTSYKRISYSPFGEPLYIRSEQASVFADQPGQMNIPEKIPDLIEKHTAERKEKIKKEEPKQIGFLMDLQSKMESIICLYKFLEKNNLCILYSQGIDIPSIFGAKIIGNETVWVEEIYLNSFAYHQIQKTVNRFIKIKLIPFKEELETFKKNKFKTKEEIDASSDRRHLSFQTWLLFGGVIASTFIAVLTSPDPQTYSEEIKTINDRVNQLATKVDQLNSNQRSLESLSADPQFIIPDD